MEWYSKLFDKCNTEESQQIQLMFHWCQNVNVYNVENHYHFYTDQQIRTPNIPEKAFEKLKVTPIQLGNRKYNSRSCSKKGLNLAKELEKRQCLSPTTKATFTKAVEKNQYYNSSVMCDQHGRSATIYQSDIVKTRSHQSETPIHSMLNLPCLPPNLYKTQRIHRKNKPATSIYQDLGVKQQNNNLLTQLYATKSRIYPTRTTYSNPIQQPNQLSAWQSKQANTHFNSQTHAQDLNINQISKNQKLKQSEVSIRTKIERPEISSSQIVSSRDRTENLDSFSQPGYNNSKYNTSKSGSLQDQDNSHERFYFRILQMSKGQARQASIILSNILSRSGRNSISHCSNPKINHDRRMFFEERQTILSQNDALSQASLKIEESQIYDLDPHNNFTLITNKTITFPHYTLDLAIENATKCVVSLKEVGFREMSAISQELQMYQFLEQKLINTDTYHNILELYQVQMSNGSYLLIKQPYTHSLAQQIQAQPQTNLPTLFKQLQQTVKGLLEQFANHLMFPTRLLNLQDFVLCESVIKFHDLSVFRQMKGPIFEPELLMKKLYTQAYQNCKEKR